MIGGLPNYISFFAHDKPLPCASTTPSTRTHFVCGYTHIVDGGRAFLIANDLYFHSISATLVQSAGLCMGDFIEGRTDGVNITAISIVNGHDPDENTEDKYFNTIEGITPCKSITLGKTCIKLGERAIVTSDSQKRINTIAGHVGALPSNIHSIALALDKDDQVMNHLIKSGISTVYLTDPTISIKKQFTLCLFALFHAKHIAMHEGIDVVFFIDSLNKMIRLYNKLSSPDGKIEPGKMDVAAISDLKTFFSSTKAFEKGSLTIVAHINPSASDFDKMVLAEFDELAHAKF